ncbi:GNAT family N-acetyltransferase [Gemmobacter lutimaris]|uniref:GNAT family N-acetyltransferase n=1 Tax=Gemmobacter lutimaris TaxID=2306023 RepID=A0A398BR55_9RHOB|nr:GNAT family N-acetyltransferase [Gemmobacter lutimaris]RID93105.1 GNAT family N-acetyltransferase [Gemmobacter lutimaris]
MPLRRAGPEDAAALARLHHRVWLECYETLAPPEAVAALTEARRLDQWTRLLAGDDPVTVIAGEGAAGFVCFGAPSDPVFGARGEIRHLYLRPDQRGRGVGRRLLTAALEALQAQGYPGAALAVVEENAAARAFYAVAGGADEGGFTDKGPLWRSRNRMVSWCFPTGTS